MLHGSEISPPAAPQPAAPVARSGVWGHVSTFFRELGPAGPLAAVMIGLPVAGGVVLLGTLNRVGPWLRANHSPAVVVGATLAIGALVGFSLVPTYMLEILAGWAFGTAVGTVVAVGGITAAALLSYHLSRLLVRGKVIHSIHHHPRSEAVRKALLGSGPVRAGTIVALLRLAPIVPFGATNLLMASAGCHRFPFAVGTALGVLPRTAGIVFVSAQMAHLSFTQEPGLLVISVVATVVALVVIGVLAKRALRQVTREHPYTSSSSSG